VIHVNAFLAACESNPVLLNTFAQAIAFVTLQHGKLCRRLTRAARTFRSHLNYQLNS